MKKYRLAIFLTVLGACFIGVTCYRESQRYNTILKTVSTTGKVTVEDHKVTPLQEEQLTLTFVIQRDFGGESIVEFSSRVILLCKKDQITLVGYQDDLVKSHKENLSVLDSFHKYAKKDKTNGFYQVWSMCHIQFWDKYQRLSFGERMAYQKLGYKLAEDGCGFRVQEDFWSEFRWVAQENTIEILFDGEVVEAIARKI